MAQTEAEAVEKLAAAVADYEKGVAANYGNIKATLYTIFDQRKRNEDMYPDEVHLRKDDGPCETASANMPTRKLFHWRLLPQEVCNLQSRILECSTCLLRARPSSV